MWIVVFLVGPHAFLNKNVSKRLKQQVVVKGKQGRADHKTIALTDICQAQKQTAEKDRERKGVGDKKVPSVVGLPKQDRNIRGITCGQQKDDSEEEGSEKYCGVL